jgi:hypothetical protein
MSTSKHHSFEALKASPQELSLKHHSFEALERASPQELSL